MLRAWRFHERLLSDASRFLEGVRYQHCRWGTGWRGEACCMMARARPHTCGGGLSWVTTRWSLMRLGACWQALSAYGERVISLESEVEGGYLMVDVVVAW